MKMTKPKYRNLVREHVPVVMLETGGRAVVTSGRSGHPDFRVLRANKRLASTVFKCSIARGSTFNFHVKDGYIALAYVINGVAYFDKRGRAATARELVIYSREGGT